MRFLCFLFLSCQLLFLGNAQATEFLRKLRPSCGDGVCHSKEVCSGSWECVEDCCGDNGCCGTVCCGTGPNPDPTPVPEPAPAPAPAPSGDSVCVQNNAITCIADSDCPGICTQSSQQCQTNGNCSGGSNKCNKQGACQPVPATPSSPVPSAFASNPPSAPPSVFPSSLPSKTSSSSPSAPPSKTPQPTTTPSSTLKIVILSGQSNMVGHGCEAHLDFLVDNNTAEFGHLGGGIGNWSTRSDVQILYYKENDPWPTQSVPLTAMGFGAQANKFGPEVGTGWALGDAFGDDILIIKIAWGGKTMSVDFRPPDATVAEEGGNRYGYQGDMNLTLPYENGYYSNYNNDATDVYPAMSDFGYYYRQITDKIQHSLDNISTMIPDYNIKYNGHSVVGFSWFHGWNDLLATSTVSEYESLLAKLVYSLRKDLGIPNLPFVIGELGQHGQTHVGKSWYNRVEGMRASQARVANCLNNGGCTTGGDLTAMVNHDYPYYNDIPTNYTGNVKLASTSQFVTELGDAPCAPDSLGCGCPQYHYHNNAETYYRIGKSMGDALVELIQGSAIPL